MDAKLGGLLGWEDLKRYRGRGSTSRAAKAQPFTHPKSQKRTGAPTGWGTGRGTQRERGREYEYAYRAHQLYVAKDLMA